jgi:hypothetical protein
MTVSNLQCSSASRSRSCVCHAAADAVDARRGRRLALLRPGIDPREERTQLDARFHAVLLGEPLDVVAPRAPGLRGAAERNLRTQIRCHRGVVQGVGLQHTLRQGGRVLWRIRKLCETRGKRLLPQRMQAPALEAQPLGERRGRTQFKAVEQGTGVQIERRRPVSSGERALEVAHIAGDVTAQGSGAHFEACDRHGAQLHHDIAQVAARDMLGTITERQSGEAFARHPVADTREVHEQLEAPLGYQR